jgi:predicted dehydrogenase
MNNKTIFVDHTYLFSQKIREVKELIDSNSLGNIINIESIRLNSSDINEENLDVLRYLGVHDISILDFLISEQPKKVMYRKKSLNAADIYLDYEDNMSVNISIGYNLIKKVRLIKIKGDKKIIAWNDLDINNDIEPIYLELEHIKDVLLNNVKPINGYDHIKRVNEVISRLEDLSTF